MGDENSQTHLADSSKGGPQSTARLGLWLGFLAFLLIVLVFHSRLSEIEFGEKGVSAKMANPEETNKLSPQEKKAADADLSQRISELEHQAKTHPESVPVTEPAPANANTSQLSNATFQQQPAPPVNVNLSGFWMGTGGYSYQVSHSGNYIIVSAYYGGVRQAVATGQIFGPNFTLQTLNLLSHPGSLTLQVSPDQRQMTGTYQDNFTGQTMEVQMSR